MTSQDYKIAGFKEKIAKYQSNQTLWASTEKEVERRIATFKS